MLYVYAILEAPAGEAPAAVGVGDEPVRICTAGPVAAAYSEHAAGSPTPTAQNVLRHEQVVETLMRDRAILPVRFGTVFGSATSLTAVLGRNGERLSAGLNKVRGHVELGVRATWDPTEETRAGGVEPASGREYMLARLAEERRRRAVHERASVIADELHATLMRLAADGTRRVLPAPRVPMSGAYLVPRDGVGPFRRGVEAAGAGRADVRLVCTGPWPPYHFVPELDLSGGPLA